MARNQNITGVNVTGNLVANDISVVIANQSQDPPPKNIRFKVEKPIQTFTGREAFLEDLHRVVKEGHVTVLTQAAISVVAATGGIGKTETVRMYIQLHSHEYDHVIWIDAEDNSSARSQFTQLAIKLNISTDFDGKPKEFDLILVQIFEKLLQNAHVVLLVLDNAEAFEDDENLNLNGIKCLLPKSLSPFFVEPTVIVTSRNQNWSLQKMIQLDLWSEGEVIVFVIQRLGLQETSENNELVTQLGNLFGHLPIALQAAVAVILQQNRRKKKYGIQNLIDEYQNGSRKVLAQKPLDANMRPTHMSDTMLVLWNISFEKIVKFPDGELAIKILCFMAFLSPTRIPEDFLFALFQTDFSRDSFENALEILEDHSLIAPFGSADSASRSFSIHRMIQDATIENLKTTEGQKSRVIFNEKTFSNEKEVLLKLSAECTSYIETFHTHRLQRGGEIVENLVRITDHVSKHLNVKELRGLTVHVADVLRKTNEFATSIELYKKVLKATPASEDESEIRYKIKLKGDLAHAYRGEGFHQKSIELYEEVLEDESRAFGQHHKETLDTKGAIASALRRLGKYDEAAAKYSEVLQDFQNNQDTQSESFLITKNNHAVLLAAQGKTEEALKVFTEVLEEYEKNPDSKSEDVIATKGNIADVLAEQGKFEEASAMMLQNISIATRVFGPFHIDTFTCKQRYAKLLSDEGKHDAALLTSQGKTEEALRLYKEVLEEHEKNPDSKPEDVIITKGNIAVLLGEQKKFEEASAMMLQTISDATRVLGPFHLHTLVFKRHYAKLLSDEGKHDEAAPLYLEVLETQETELGSDHPDTLTTKNNLAVLYMRTKEFDKALPLLNVEVYEKVFCPEHPTTLTVTHNLAAVMVEQGKFEEAFSLHNKILKIQKQVLGPNHPETLFTMHNIGVAHYVTVEFERAAEVFQDLWPRQVKVLGENHPETMDTLDALTECREILDERNDSIVNFVTLTFADVEIGQSILKASNWNMEAALDTFFNSISTADVTGLEAQGEAFIPSRTATHFQDHSLDVISGNTTDADQIQDFEVQMESPNVISSDFNPKQSET